MAGIPWGDVEAYHQSEDDAIEVTLFTLLAGLIKYIFKVIAAGVVTIAAGLALIYAISIFS